MDWTKEDTEALLSFKSDVDSDEIKIKEKIKKTLLNNRFIIHVLANKELEDSDAEPSDYFNINILPYYMMPDSQTKTRNYLCYEVGYKEVNRYNNVVKNLQITFYILCHQDDIIEPSTSIARHDLLAALIQDQFNFTNFLGSQRIELVSDLPSTTDMKYTTRTLVFEQNTDNNVVKSRNGISKMSNKGNSWLGQ